jgi:hypothetical protein
MAALNINKNTASVLRPERFSFAAELEINW